MLLSRCGLLFISAIPLGIDLVPLSCGGAFSVVGLCNDGAGLSATLLGVARNLSDGRCWPGKPTLPLRRMPQETQGSPRVRRSRIVHHGKAQRVGTRRQEKKVLPKSSFHQRYVEAERRRAAVLQRLEGLNEAPRAHPAYRRAATLLNQTFHKASVAQRLATVQAADWLIDVLTKLV